MSNQLRDQPTILEILDRLDKIERRVGLGKYAPVTKPTHGERIEARQKDNEWSV